jgi:hypothetical protein
MQVHRYPYTVGGWEPHAPTGRGTATARESKEVRDEPAYARGSGGQLQLRHCHQRCPEHCGHGRRHHGRGRGHLRRVPGAALAHRAAQAGASRQGTVSDRDGYQRAAVTLAADVLPDPEDDDDTAGEVAR